MNFFFPSEIHAIFMFHFYELKEEVILFPILFFILAAFFFSPSCRHSRESDEKSVQGKWKRNKMHTSICWVGGGDSWCEKTRQLPASFMAAEIQGWRQPRGQCLDLGWGIGWTREALCVEVDQPKSPSSLQEHGERTESMLLTCPGWKRKPRLG